MGTEMFSLSAAERITGIDRRDVRVTARVLKIDLKPLPYNGNGKGLTGADLARICRALGHPVPTKQQRKAALAG